MINSITYSKYLIGILCCTFPILLSSCRSEIKEILISEKTMTLDANGISLGCNPPLSRYNRSASIFLEIEGNWTVNPPWKKIEFKDGRKVEINVKAIANDGQSFSSSIIGGAYKSGSAMVNARFTPEIPKNIYIKELFIKSDSKIICHKIIWHDFDNK